VGSTFSNTGDDGRVEGTIDAVRELLAQNVSVTMYAGDAGESPSSIFCHPRS
jgi:hypothetical protein